VVSEWHSRLKSGKVLREGDEHPAWPSTSETTGNVKKFWELNHEDHRRIIHGLIDTVGISCGACWES
jgi:hypothetical protein